MVTCAISPNKTHMTGAFLPRPGRVPLRPSIRFREGCVLHANQRTLLLATLIGVAACDRNAPTALPPGPAPGVSGPTPEFTVVPASLGTALRNLDAGRLRQFEAGRVVFATVFTPETGLGPLFNAVSCASCHEAPVVGGGGSNDPAEGDEDIELHATAFHGAGARCDDLAAVGGQVIQKQLTPALSAYLNLTSEPIPAAATDSGHRTTPDLFGFGLLDAVPDAEILARADPLDRNGDGISGRPNRTADGRLGRFGRKAQAATLREFNADAFVMEMGITNPVNQMEQTIGGLPLRRCRSAAGAGDQRGAARRRRCLRPLPRAPTSCAARLRRRARRGGLQEDRLQRMPRARARDRREPRSRAAIQGRAGLHRSLVARHGAGSRGHLSRRGAAVGVPHGTADGIALRDGVSP